MCAWLTLFFNDTATLQPQNGLRVRDVIGQNAGNTEMGMKNAKSSPM